MSRLPANVRVLADAMFALFQSEPFHPSLALWPKGEVCPHLSGAVVECPRLSSGFAYVYQTPDLGALRKEWQERPMVARG